MEVDDDFTKKSECDQTFDTWFKRQKPPLRGILHQVHGLLRKAFVAGWNDRGDAILRLLIIEQPKLVARHVCSFLCDGQDGASSQCAQEQRKAKKRKKP